MHLKCFRFSLDDTVHDYGDIFREIYSLLEEPFSYRLVVFSIYMYVILKGVKEINTKCNDAFEHLQISLEEKERLCEELDGFFRDKLGVGLAFKMTASSLFKANIQSFRCFASNSQRSHLYGQKFCQSLLDFLAVVSRVRRSTTNGFKHRTHGIQSRWFTNKVLWTRLEQALVAPQHHATPKNVHLWNSE